MSKKFSELTRQELEDEVAKWFDEYHRDNPNTKVNAAILMQLFQSEIRSRATTLLTKIAIGIALVSVIVASASATYTFMNRLPTAQQTKNVNCIQASANKQLNQHAAFCLISPVC